MGFITGKTVSRPFDNAGTTADLTGDNPIKSEFSLEIFHVNISFSIFTS